MTRKPPRSRTRRSRWRTGESGRGRAPSVLDDIHGLPAVAGLPRAAPPGSSSASPIPATADEYLNDLDLTRYDGVDDSILPDSEAILPRLRPFDCSDVRLGPRVKRVLFQYAHSLRDSRTEVLGQLSQLTSRRLRNGDPERHSSSNGM